MSMHLKTITKKAEDILTIPLRTRVIKNAFPTTMSHLPATPILASTLHALTHPPTPASPDDIDIANHNSSSADLVLSKKRKRRTKIGRTGIQTIDEVVLDGGFVDRGTGAVVGVATEKGLVFEIDFKGAGDGAVGGREGKRGERGRERGGMRGEVEVGDLVSGCLSVFCFAVRDISRSYIVGWPRL